MSGLRMACTLVTGWLAPNSYAMRCTLAPVLQKVSEHACIHTTWSTSVEFLSRPKQYKSNQAPKQKQN
jgi:hypothetical protein